MSLDGYVAGPHQSVKEPLGVGGERLHEWIFPLEAWHRMAGKPGGETGPSNTVVEESWVNLGATIMGRNMFGGHPGPWDPKKPWNGWWGKSPPFHHDVFVLTHHAREPLPMEGGTTFHFVTDGIESALTQARRAAGDQDVQLSGGAKAAQQYLAAGLVDGGGVTLDGLEVVFDIRDPMEPRPFDEPGMVRELGMRYENVPVRQGALDDAVMDAALAVLRGHAGEPMLLHCASANRLGGVLIPYFILDHGMSEDAAIEAAMKVGLRGADLLEWGLDYARRKTGG